ncbi:MAG: hypothetical protein HY347_09140 [candidate division NC10 bacterium]|nr:hypothetical protein [candidate division NC10 bacterium]
MVEVARKLHEFADGLRREPGYDVTWGKGAIQGTFTCKKLIGSSWVTLFSVSSDGKLWLDFGMKQKDLLGQALETLHQTVTQIPGVSLPPDVLEPGVSRYPSFPLQRFVNPEHLDKFKEAIWFLVNVESSHAN